MISKKWKPWLIVFGIVALFAMIGSESSAAGPAGQEAFATHDLALDQAATVTQEAADDVARTAATFSAFNNSASTAKIAGDQESAGATIHIRRTP